MADRTHIVSVSGGKDSVALWLWAVRSGLSPVAVYVDTGWEWDGHRAHLDILEQRIGKLYRIAPTETFEQATLRKGTFPSRVRKWCTEELKIRPFRKWLDRYRDDHGVDVVVLLGIRREESKARETATEHEWAEHYDCEVWRPILDWAIEDVAAEHRRAGIPMHPLYHHGAERVGCWPCVNASKAELAVIGGIDPGRIEKVRDMEAVIGQTMFTRDRRTEKKAAGGAGPSVAPVGIDDVMQWAKTERGGVQLSLIQPRSGCARWGVCEPPPDARRGGK
jgi:3'-phosphoadenosine 5'-phosphosulfate sulfotransferase (PAPS reductase)/FAD synthetase